MELWKFPCIVSYCGAAAQKTLQLCSQNIPKVLQLLGLRGSSVVECRTSNHVSPGSNPPLLLFRRLGIFVLSIDAPVDSAVVNEYRLAIYSLVEMLVI